MESRRREARSSNSEKIPNKKSKPTRGLGWSDEETECLLSVLYNSNTDQRLEDTKSKKGSIYETISTEMGNQGHPRTREQCKIRVHTLKRGFLDCEKRLKASGKGRNLCKFYDQLNEVFGQRPASSHVKLERMGRKRIVPALPEDWVTGADGVSIAEEADTDDTQTDEGGITDDDGNTGNLSEQSEVDAVDDTGTMDEVQIKVRTAEKDQPEGKTEGNVIEEEQCRNHAEQMNITSSAKRREKTSRSETTLGSLISGFTESYSKFEAALLSIENKRIDADLKKIEFEKQKLAADERQKREERDHQFRMMQMILGRMNHPQGTSHLPSPSDVTQVVAQQHYDMQDEHPSSRLPNNSCNDNGQS